MLVPLKALVLACAATLAAAAHASETRVGLAAPLEGPLALLGAQMLDGASVAAAGNGAELIAADDGCSAEGGAAAARELIARRVEIVVGFLCNEAVEAALPILTAAGVPVITSGVRADALTDRRHKTGWLIWRAGPRTDAEASAVAEILSRRWRD